MSKQISAKILAPIFGAGSVKSQLFRYRGVTLAMTFIVYTVYHMSRRPLSIVKGTLARDCHNETITNHTDYSCNEPPFNHSNAIQLMGVLDSCFLFTYAICMFFSGYLAERSNLRYFLAAALACCGLNCILFGLAHPFKIQALWYFIIIQILSGITQTTGWPAVVAVVGNWFGSAKKGLIFGIWNWHTSVGNILGALIAGLFADDNWELSFIVPGIICIAAGVLVFFFLLPDPSCVGLEVSFEEKAEDTQVQSQIKPEAPGVYINEAFASQHTLAHSDFSINNSSTHAMVSEESNLKRSEQAISLWQALLIPGVIEFSACLFFAKLVSYTFLYWLPLYLNEEAHYSTSRSAFISVTFDIGGCLGSLVAGLLADKTGASALTCIVFLSLTIPSVMQFITGMFINGPYALITTAVSANLACKVPSQSAMATVSAIIDGTGSFGAALGPTFAGFVSASGWKNVFYMAMLADVCAVISLIRVGFLQEFKVLRAKYFKK